MPTVEVLDEYPVEIEGVSEVLVPELTSDPEAETAVIVGVPDATPP